VTGKAPPVSRSRDYAFEAFAKERNRPASRREAARTTRKAPRVGGWLEKEEGDAVNAAVLPQPRAATRSLVAEPHAQSTTRDSISPEEAGRRSEMQPEWRIETPTMGPLLRTPKQARKDPSSGTKGDDPKLVRRPRRRRRRARPPPHSPARPCPRRGPALRPLPPLMTSSPLGMFAEPWSRPIFEEANEPADFPPLPQPPRTPRVQPPLGRPIVIRAERLP